MNEEVKQESVHIHSRADELIACLEGEIAKRDEELAACRVAVENCELFRARIAELEDDLKCAHSMLCEVSKSGMVLRAELAAIKAQEPVAAVKHGPLDSDGWPEFVRVETIGDFDLENLPSGMKLYAAPVAPLYAAPAAPAADAGKLADAFLSWKLPDSVRPDGCAMDPTYPHRYGTNLMAWAQAKEMFEYVLVAHRAKGVPSAKS